MNEDAILYPEETMGKGHKNILNATAPPGVIDLMNGVSCLVASNVWFISTVQD